MGMLKITDCTGQHFTCVDHAFIDSYMAKANGEYVKVYLLLLRRMESSSPFSVSELRTFLLQRRPAAFRVLLQYILFLLSPHSRTDGKACFCLCRGRTFLRSKCFARHSSPALSIWLGDIWRTVLMIMSLIYSLNAHPKKRAAFSHIIMRGKNSLR